MSGCGHVTPAARPQLSISGSLLDPGKPATVADPAAATQGDAARAYGGTYAAWEGCAANLEAVSGILQADGWIILPLGQTAEKAGTSAKTWTLHTN